MQGSTDRALFHLAIVGMAVFVVVAAVVTATYVILFKHFERLMLRPAPMSPPWWRINRAPLLSRVAPQFRGVSGFTSTLAHAGGPPFAIYMLAQKVDKTLFVGTAAVFFIVINYVKLVPYYFLGQLSVGNLTTALLFAPLAPIGVWFGVWVHRRLSQKIFLNASYALLLATGMKLIYDGLTR